MKRILCLALALLMKGGRILKWLQYAFALTMLSILCLNCLKTSFIKPNVQELLLSDYDTITWSDYFAPDVMEQVEEYINRRRQEIITQIITSLRP